MFFKNASLYRLPAPWAMSTAQLIELLTPQKFQPTTGLEMSSMGWVAPCPDGDLVHCVNQQMLLTLKTEKKLLPTAVINEFAKARAAEIEEQQGFKAGRKQMREIKEAITDELLPRAFNLSGSTNVWVDPVNGWLVVDSASPAKCDDVLKLLMKAIDKFPLETLQVVQSPVSAMTEWLLADTAPSGFTVDQDTELRASGEGKATVRYVRHTLEAEDVQRHIAGGKQCTRLALTWGDKISFVLTESLIIKRIAPLDVIKEGEASVAKDAAERFDSDFVLMCGELAKMFPDLVDSLGGFVEKKSA